MTIIICIWKAIDLQGRRPIYPHRESSFRQKSVSLRSLSKSYHHSSLFLQAFCSHFSERRPSFPAINFRLFSAFSYNNLGMFHQTTDTWKSLYGMFF